MPRPASARPSERAVSRWAGSAPGEEPQKTVRREICTARSNRTRAVTASAFATASTSRSTVGWATMTFALSDLPAMDVAGRVARLRAALADGAEADAVLLTNLTNIRYLTGFSGSAALLL